MTQLPEAEKEKIAEQVADFKKVKSKLDAEIEIWDDTSNDIIVLAKKMCMIDLIFVSSGFWKKRKKSVGLKK